MGTCTHCSGDFDGHRLHLGSKRCLPHSPGSSLGFRPRQLRLFVNLGINNPNGADPHLPAPLCLSRNSQGCRELLHLHRGISERDLPWWMPSHSRHEHRGGKSKQPLPLLQEAFSAGSDAVEHETGKLERLAENSPLRSATGHILVCGDSRTTLPTNRKKKEISP